MGREGGEGRLWLREWIELDGCDARYEYEFIVMV